MRKPGGVWWRRAAAAGAIAALVGMAAPALRADDGDGPSQQRRAVRLSSVDGQVELIQDGQAVADHALANTPLFEGAQLTTADDGRAEVQFEDGSMARIPPNSSLTLSVLRPGGDTEVTLNSGLGYFEVHGGQGAPMRVRFGSNVVTCSSFAVLRVKMDEAPGELAVFSGNAHLEASNGVQVDLNGGDSVPLNNYSVAQSIEPDSWDAWNSDRDQAITTSEENSGAPSGVPNGNNPAWADLNQNGTWYNVPDQGSVWSPYEASNADWDPYGTGYWMFQPGFGYTWVSAEPWGYMPYQCGAWNWYNSFGWGWAPGACTPWWGGSVFVVNIGYAPRWYRHPIRPVAPPHPHPINPHDTSNRQFATAVHPVGPRPVVPVLAVNRQADDGGSKPPADIVLPPRNRTNPVMIGNAIANPIASQPPRQGYNHLPASTVRPVAPTAGTILDRPGYVRTPEAPPSGRTPSVPVSRPGGSTYPSGGSRPVYTPPPSSSHPAPSYHPPAGGGGGGRPAAPSGGGSHPAGGSPRGR